MQMNTLGDMAQTRMLGLRQTDLKHRIGQLTQELTTGRTSDASKKLAGDFSYVVDLEQSLHRLGGYRTSIAEAASFTRGLQTTLDRIQSASTDLAGQLLTSGASTIPQVVSNGSVQASDTFQTLVSAMNTQIAGRSLLSGTATDSAPLIDANAFLSQIKAAVAGSLTAADMQTAAQSWFDDSGGFASLAYLGADTSLSPLPLASGVSASVNIRADDPAFQEVLMQTALAALADDADLNLSTQDKSALIGDAGLALLKSNDALTGLRAQIGATEEKIEASSVQNQAAITAAEMAKSNLLGVDPYESATRLEEVQFQLESLYSLTVRASRLSLLSYMR